MNYATKEAIKIFLVIMIGGVLGTAAIVALVLTSGCSAQMPPGAGWCQDGWEQQDGRCYHAIWESTSARGAEGVCERLGARLAPDRENEDYLDQLAGGRSFWVGEETDDGCVFYADGVAKVMSCYPQPNPMDYPRAYVCEADQVSR